jgi:hypothetical protein
VHARRFHQSLFAGDPVQITQQQKAQKNFGVNRGTTDRTVGSSQPFAHEYEINAAVQALQEMILGNLIF